MSSLLFIFILNVVFFTGISLIKNIHIASAITVLFFFILLFILRQTKIITANSVIKSNHFVIKDSHYTTATVCLIAFVILEKYIGFNASLFTSFFIFSHLNKLKSRITFLIALFFLALTALLTAARSNVTAEKTAIIVFYFLVIGVIWYFLDFVKEQLSNRKIV